MLMQTSQLQDIQPKTKLDGFWVDMRRHNSSIVDQTRNEDLVIDYYFEVTVACDGRNPSFREVGHFSILISQLITECGLEFVSTCPVLMLKQYEKLNTITVEHGEMENMSGVWLACTIEDCRTSKQTVRGYLFRPD